MKDLKITIELLKDINELLLELRTFMTLNMVHLDENMQGDAKVKLQELVKYSNEQAKELTFFKEPVLNYSKTNMEILGKNFNNIINWIYEYLKYVEPILKKYNPEMYRSRFKQLKEKYSVFSKKYLS